MNRAILGLVGILLIAGCTDSTRENEVGNGKTSSAVAENGSGGSDADRQSAVDAEQVLASALENARANDKRVLVHLGAPW